MLEAERREVVVAHVHLFDDPGQRLCGLLGVGDDRRDQVRHALIGGEFDALGVDQDEAHLGRLGAHQNRGNHRVDERGFSGTGCTGHQEVRHLGQVGHNVATFDVFADADGQRMCALGGHRGSQDVAERHRLAVDVWNLDADERLARDRRQDANLVARDRVGDVAREARDGLDLDAWC